MEGFVVFMRKRIIRISIDKAKEALGSKEREEALAFALSIKFRFVSSTLKGKYTTKKHVKSLFKIGDEKLTRILNNAVDFGYIRFEDDRIIANRLYSDINLTYTIHVDRKVLLNKDAIKLLRHAVAVNHVGILTFYSDRKTRQANPKTIGDVKMRNGKQYFSTGISNFRMAEVLSCKVWKAKQILKELTVKGIFTKEEQYKPALIKGHINLRIWNQFANDGVFIKRRNGILVQQLANKYTLNDKTLIRFFNAGKFN